VPTSNIFLQALEPLTRGELVFLVNTIDVLVAPARLDLSAPLFETRHQWVVAGKLALVRGLIDNRLTRLPDRNYRNVCHQLSHPGTARVSY